MPELIIIMVIALIIFGPRKLPELGRSLGKSINEFKKASNELRSTLEEEIRVDEQKERQAKIAAEQQSAIAGAEVHTVTPSPVATPPAAVSPAAPAEETVSRTPTTGTHA